MKVFCYRNLRTPKGTILWSIKDTKTGLVVDRAHAVCVRNARLRVSKAGRERVLRDKRKNVHAGIVGERVADLPDGLVWVRVTYNPYAGDTFVVTGTQQPVLSAEYVKLTETGCYVSNPN